MFSRKVHGPAGDQAVTRRRFLQTGASVLGVSIIGAFLGRSLFSVLPRLDFYRKAMLRRNLSGGPVTVYKMVPLPGIKYGGAETRHMANKVFTSVAAARAHRPHGGFVYGLKAVPLAAPLVSGMDAYTLFCNRKDFDQRVHADRHHWQQLGVDVNAVFNVIRSA